MKAGQLTDRIDIQRRVAGLTAAGERVESWVLLVENRAASVVRVRGEEKPGQAQIVATELVEIRIRLSNNVADLSPRDRIVFPAGDSAAANTFDILAVHEIGRGEGLRIAARRRSD